MVPESFDLSISVKTWLISCALTNFAAEIKQKVNENSERASEIARRPRVKQVKNVKHFNFGENFVLVSQLHKSLQVRKNNVQENQTSVGA